MLRAALESALGGRGRLVLIGGEPGIGKSRLADELATLARRRGARVLIGRCWEAGGAPPYWPWTQSLREYARGCERAELRRRLGAGGAYVAQLLPEIRELVPGLGESPLPPSPTARFQLFDAVATFAADAAAAQPLVFVLDDLHAADEPSLLLLRFLAHALAASRVLVLGGYRDTEVSANGALATALAELRREAGGEQLTLRGLDERETASFVALSAGLDPAPRLAAAIQRETEGNPLFVTELVRLLAAEGELAELGEESSLALPEGVETAIERRLGRLSPECRRTLSLAAVFGREFRVDALQALGIDPVAQLEEAIAARVIGDVPAARGRMRFSHALVRDALYLALPGPRRAQLHQAAGEALERVYGSDVEPHLSELAHHFLEAAPAGDAPKAVGYARRAGERAARALAYEEAYRLYGVALEAAEAHGAGAEERCELMLARALALNRADGDGPRPRAAYAAAVELATAAGLPEHRARAVLGYSGLYTVTRVAQHPEVPAMFEGALAALGDGDGRLRVGLLAKFAGAHRQEPRRERREALAREALASARRLGDQATLADALEGFWFSVRGPDNVAECAALERELIDVARRLGAREHELAGHDYAFLTAWQLADPDALEREFSAFCRLCDELRDPGALWNVLTLKGMRALAARDFTAAEELFAGALQAGRVAHGWLPSALHRMQTFVLRRDEGRLLELEGLRAAAPTDFAHSLAHAGVVAHIHAACGRPEAARHALREVLHPDLRHRHRDEAWLFCVTLMAQACGPVGDPELAAIAHDLLLPYREQIAVARRQASLGPVAGALATTADLIGRPDEASAHDELARTLGERMRAQPSAARA